jgi:hypothetical protein
MYFHRFAATIKKLTKVVVAVPQVQQIKGLSTSSPIHGKYIPAKSDKTL